MTICIVYTYMSSVAVDYRAAAPKKKTKKLNKSNWDKDKDKNKNVEKENWTDSVKKSNFPVKSKHKLKVCALNISFKKSVTR